MESSSLPFLCLDKRADVDRNSSLSRIHSLIHAIIHALIHVILHEEIPSRRGQEEEQEDQEEGQHQEKEGEDGKISIAVEGGVEEDGTISIAALISRECVVSIIMAAVAAAEKTAVELEVIAQRLVLKRQ